MINTIETQNSFETTAQVCAHRVEIRYWGFRTELTGNLESRLTAEGEERAQELIAEGYIEGELNCYCPATDEEICGYWEIKND